MCCNWPYSLCCWRMAWRGVAQVAGEAPDELVDALLRPQMHRLPMDAAAAARALKDACADSLRVLPQPARATRAGPSGGAADAAGAGVTSHVHCTLCLPACFGQACQAGMCICMVHAAWSKQQAKGGAAHKH